MAEALRAAGVVTADERLRGIARMVLHMTSAEWEQAVQLSWDDPAQRTRLLETAMQAVKTNPRNWDGAKDALYKAVKSDADLLWAMFEPYRVVAMQRLLTDAAALVRAQESKLQPKLREVGGRVQASSRPGAPERKPADTRPQSAGGQAGCDNQKQNAPSRSGMDGRADVVRWSMLDSFPINGRKLGDCTPQEAEKWAGSRERDARFVKLVIANLPANEPIRKYRRPDEVDAMYEEASNAT